MNENLYQHERNRTRNRKRYREQQRLDDVAMTYDAVTGQSGERTDHRPRDHDAKESQRGVEEIQIVETFHKGRRRWRDMTPVRVWTSIRKSRGHRVHDTCVLIMLSR